MSISGKSGLFKIIAQAKNGTIVESLLDEKRFPVFAHEKVSSLEEISVFTTDEDLPLKQVFKNIFLKESGGRAIDSKSETEDLKGYFLAVLPDYDRERVYISDIRKILSWYNLLVDKGLLEIKEEPTEAEDEAKGEETKAVETENATEE